MGVGLSARHSAVIGITDGGPRDGATPDVAPATETAVAAACLLAVAVIVGYGPWIILS